MAKQKFDVTVRNTFVKVIVVLCGLYMLFMFINYLNIGFIRGFGFAKNLYLNQPPIQVTYQVYQRFFKRYWKSLLNPNTIRQFNRYKKYYFVYITTTFLPVIFVVVIAKRYKNQFIDWQPFEQPQSEFGEAHWASLQEMKKAKLFEKRGVLLGKYKGKFLVEYSFQHILLFAPTGSGKGVGFVIPNLLFWDESVIVHDVKLENYEKTSGYRFSVLKQKVFLWNPADQEGITHCYNPLDWISRDAGGVVDDIQKIAKFLMPKEDFWNSEARSLAVGLMLALFASPDKPMTLGEVLRMIRSEDLAYSLAVVLDTIGSKLHPVGYMNINSFLNKADKERSGVTSTASSCLELWSNPFVDTATSKSHTNIGSYRTIPTSLFVGISPNNLDRLKPLLQIFYQQCATLFTNKMPTKKEKIGVMMLLDEFPTLGEMNEIKVGIAYYRGYKVKLFLIVQDTEQLKGTYKDSGMNSFLSNSYYRITFAANNASTARMISELLGKGVVETESGGGKKKFINLSPGAGDVTMTKKQRDLLMPQEVITLPRDEEIILIESKSPVRCNKIKYYEEPLFKKRVDMPKSYVPTQTPYIATVSKKDSESTSGNSEEARHSTNA